MRPGMHHAEPFDYAQDRLLHSSAHLYVGIGVCPRACNLRQAEEVSLVVQRDGIEPSATGAYHIVLRWYLGK